MNAYILGHKMIYYIPYCEWESDMKNATWSNGSLLFIRIVNDIFKKEGEAVNKSEKCVFSLD